MKRILATAAIAFSMIGMGASAATFSIVGGSSDSVPGGSTGLEPVTPKNEVLDALGIGTYDAVEDRYELGGFLDGVSIGLNNSTKVRVDLLGWEAGFENSFTLDGNTVGKGLNGVTNASFAAGDALDSFVTGIVSSLDFLFSSENGGVAQGSVTNDGADNTLPGPNFFASCGVGLEAERNCDVLYLLYDDGDVVNDNHDDLVVRLTAVAVPLPAGALLLLSGLGALAIRRKRA